MKAIEVIREALKAGNPNAIELAVSVIGRNKVSEMPLEEVLLVSTLMHEAKAAGK